MVPVDLVHSLTYYIAAKQLSAYPSPDEWNTYAGLANIDLYNFYNDEREKLLLQIKSGQQIFVPQPLSTFVVNELKLNPALSSASQQSASMPTDYCYDISIVTPIGGINNTVKKVDYEKLPGYLNSTIDLPTAATPIYVELSDRFNFYPTISNPIYLSYYRYPKTPVWNYSITNNVPTYNPTGSVDFDFEFTEYLRLSMRILAYMGISIRDDLLAQAAQQMTMGAS